VIHRKAGVSPVDQAGCQSSADEPPFEEELDNDPAEILRHAFDISERKMHKSAGLIEPTLQDEAMKVRVPSQKLAAGLVGRRFPKGARTIPVFTGLLAVLV